MGSRGGNQGTEDSGRWLEEPANPAQAELRQALDRASARGADEVALRRVWARLAETQCLVPMASDRLGQAAGDASRPTRWPWIVAASLAGAAATLAFMLVQTKSDVRMARIVTSEPAGVVASSKRAAADQRSTLVGPATVRTGFGETLHLDLRGGTEVTVTSESVLVLDESDRLSVSTGEVQFHVPPQPAGRTFTVTAGAYRVVVVGTRFRVRVNHLNAAIGVDEGTVEIWNDHRIARIGAGESWVGPSLAQTPAGAKSDQPVSDPSAFERVVAAIPVSATHVVRTAGLVRASTAGSAIRKLGSRARARQDARPGTKQMLALSSPVSVSSRSVATAVSSTGLSGSGPAVAAGSSSTAGSGNAVVPAAPVAPTIAPAPAAPTPRVDPTPLAVQARAARAAGDSRKALDLYRALAQKGGTAGENAEYEMGRVLRDDLHQPGEAVATWRAYRAQHPRGLLRIEADISVIETLVKGGDKSGALAEGSDFIRRYPDSERRMEMARLTGDLLRERGDCSAAIGAYDLAMTSGRGRRDIADSVSFHRSICLLRSDRTAGSAALRTYLQSFPAGHFRLDAQRLLADVPSPAPATARP